MVKKLGKRFLAVVAGILSLVIISGGLHIFDLQWHISGYSRPLEVVYDQNNLEFNKIYEMNGETVYTYGLSDCGVINFWNGEAVSLSEAFLDGFTMTDATKHLEMTEGEDCVWYTAENYVIVKADKNIVISQKRGEPSEVIAMLSK